jgi:hypothetical protein
MRNSPVCNSGATSTCHLFSSRVQNPLCLPIERIFDLDEILRFVGKGRRVELFWKLW